MKRSAPLDLLRTIAILLVFADHFRIFAGNDWFSSVGQIGRIGVDLFFVLSGFLIASQLLKPVSTGNFPSLKEFYIRRGLRIWPNYVAVLAIYLTIPEFTERSELPPLWKFITFTQNFGLDFKAQGAFSHAWSLCVEEQFYLLLPVFIFLSIRYGSLRRTLFFFTALILGGILLRYQLWQNYVSEFYNSGNLRAITIPYFREIYYPTYCRLDGLVIGVCIAALYRLRPEIWKKLNPYSNWFLAFGTLLLSFSIYLFFDEISLLTTTLGFSLVNLAFGLLLLAAVMPSGIFSKVKVPGARAGATLAFSFYLTHKQMIHLTQGWLLDYGVEKTSVLYPTGIFIMCLAVAAALYFFIEKPFLLLRDRLLHERSLHFSK